MPSGRYTDIIERLKPGAASEGDIVDLDGKVLGRHNGIIHFTVGQRKGLGIAAASRFMSCGSMPRSGRVIVGPREALRTRRISLRDVNWIGDGAIEDALASGGREIFVKVRSTRAPQAGVALRQDCDGIVCVELDRRRGRRVARPGLRLLRRGRRPGACARRRIHQERAGAFR